MNFKPYSVTALALSGFILVGMGLYFIFLRPSLLPEDLLFMNSSSQNIEANLPGLLNWLPKVFWVMGGYIFTTGILIIFISFTSFRSRLYGAFSMVVLAGISSIGLMTVVNFILHSDFRWLLFSFSLTWIIALILYLFKK